MSPLRRQLPKGMWPLRWMRYTCNRTHKQSCFFPRHAAPTVAPIRCFVRFLLTHFTFFGIPSWPRWEIREKSRHVGPAQCQVGDSLKITLTSDYPHMERNVCDATRLSSDFPPFFFYAKHTYIEASSVMPGFCLATHWQQLLPKSRVRNFV